MVPEQPVNPLTTPEEALAAHRLFNDLWECPQELRQVKTAPTRKPLPVPRPQAVAAGGGEGPAIGRRLPDLG